MNTLKIQVLVFVFTAATALAGNPLDTWRTIQGQPAPDGFISSYGGGHWVGFGNGLMSSTNGIEWEGISLSGNYSFDTFKYANGLWVAGGKRYLPVNCGVQSSYCDGLFTSINGVVWTEHREVTELLCSL